VMNAQGKLLMECVLETKASTIVEFIQRVAGNVVADVRGRDVGGLAARFVEASR
jgi:hypothetical protein